jgi:PadR family transcriptional regulator, regulatory protein PadR
LSQLDIASISKCQHKEHRVDVHVRLSERGLRVLRFMIDQPRASRSGAEIAKATKIGSGTLYPLLARLEAAGWFTSQWETVDPREAGRPRRRLYKLTGVGQRRAREALAGLQLGTGAAVWAT